MPQITLNDTIMHTYGELPTLGTKAPNFVLVDQHCKVHDLSTHYENQSVLINVYPSLDTAICFESMQRFCEIVAGTNLMIIGVSMDTPFALQRIAPSLGDDVLLLSDMRNRYFGTDYGVTIADGPLGGFLARAVFLLDAEHHVQYVEMVEDVSRPPNYESILAKL